MMCRRGRIDPVWIIVTIALGGIAVAVGWMVSQAPSPASRSSPTAVCPAAPAPSPARTYSPSPTAQPTYSPPAPVYVPPRSRQPAAANYGACPKGGSHVPGKVDANGRLHCAKCGRYM